MKTKGRLVPIPKRGRRWGCVRCSVDLDRQVLAVVLLKYDDDPEGVRTAYGLCAHHAEVHQEVKEERAEDVRQEGTTNVATER
jgi:hypothetical protein